MRHCLSPQPGARHPKSYAPMPPRAGVRPVCVTKLCVIAVSRRKKMVYHCMRISFVSRVLRHQLPLGVFSSGRLPCPARSGQRSVRGTFRIGSSGDRFDASPFALPRGYNQANGVLRAARPSAYPTPDD